MARTKRKAEAAATAYVPSRELTDWTALRNQIRAEWDKRKRPVIVFPDKASQLAWLAEGARTGVVPPLPEGAYYE